VITTSRICGGRYKLSASQQAEAIKMTRIGEKSQAEIAELFNVDRSTISRMMKEVRERELLKAGR
jgi:DNA-directed RNA polymerase specialized sigma24 family protein